MAIVMTPLQPPIYLTEPLLTQKVVSEDKVVVAQELLLGTLSGAVLGQGRGMLRGQNQMLLGVD